MEVKVTKFSCVCFPFFVLPFFIFGFTPEIFATQTGLPVSEILIEMNWNL